MDIETTKIKKESSNCRTKFIKTVGRFESYAECTCSKCGHIFTTKQLMATISKIRNQIAERLGANL